MKQNKNELDVDFIGGHAPLTEEEAKAISAYIKHKKPNNQLLLGKSKKDLRKERK